MAALLSHRRSLLLNRRLDGLSSLLGSRRVTATQTFPPRPQAGRECLVAGLCTSTPSTRQPHHLRSWRGVQDRKAVPFLAKGFRTDASQTGPEPPSFAFAFDIDGVLLHVSRPIPGAPETLQFLSDNNIPFILLTNGGGKHELDRVKNLSDELGVHLTTDNFVQSHTPFQELLDGPDGLREKTVLVTGSDYNRCRNIFQAYGFRRVVTVGDIFNADKSIFPFSPPNFEGSGGPCPLPAPLYQPPERTHSDTSLPITSTLKIDAIFVLNDPRDWALDLQVITDILLSHRGYVGTYSPLNNNPSLPNNGWQQDGQPPIYFSNSDLLWAARYHLPRLGQGAFQAALEGLWRRITGGAELQNVTRYGKPFANTYRYAEGVLADHRAETLRKMGIKLVDECGEGECGKKGHPPLKRVYMVGDNPESDIAGANSYASKEGTEWVSVLVRTGVWKPEMGRKLDGVHKPKQIVKDVREGVRWALEKEGWKGKEL